MALGGLLPSGSPMKLLGFFVFILVALFIVNNVNFLGELTKKRIV